MYCNIRGYYVLQAFLFQFEKFRTSYHDIAWGVRSVQRRILGSQPNKVSRAHPERGLTCSDPGILSGDPQKISLRYDRGVFSYGKLEFS